MDGCRLLLREDVESAARVLAEALDEDPLCVHMLPSRRARQRALRVFFRVMGRISVDNGRMYGTGDPLVGVALWKRPSQGDISIGVRALGSLLPLLLTRYPIGLLRARSVVRETGAMHARYAPGPHYYLDNLGVVPAARGRGAAGCLVRPFLKAAEAEHVLVYTDTINAENVPFYGHFGFRLAEQRAVPGTRIAVYGLLREPRQVRSEVETG
jgi:ribosomal protein S18 acetylase RimI-like enzyme